MNGVTEVAHPATQPQVPFDVRHGSRRLLTDSGQEVGDAGAAQDKGTEHVAVQSGPLAGSMPQALLGTGTSRA
jgi:hypothetical protein